MGRSHVEGMSTYRVDADVDTKANAWTMAEHRLRVAASIYGGEPDGEIDANTHQVGGVVLVRMRCKLRITTDHPIER
jgi:hypothetical protein